MFVTTDIHCLLEEAINAVSFSGANGTESIAYRPNDAKDLNYSYPGQHRKQDWPTVYHLLGRCSKFPDEYVISEADLLEFVCALQSDRWARQPKKLFDALRFSYLLFLGGNYPDWLAQVLSADSGRIGYRTIGNWTTGSSWKSWPTRVRRRMRAWWYFSNTFSTSTWSFAAAARWSSSMNYGGALAPGQSASPGAELGAAAGTGFPGERRLLELCLRRSPSRAKTQRGPGE